MTILRFATILILALSAHQPLALNPYSQNIARAEAYLINRLTPKLGLVYESDDPGRHWLSGEYQGFHWSYNQTYWLYSDNLFAYLALERDYPQISREISSSINQYQAPSSGVFEVVAGEHISLPLHAAGDYIVAQSANYAIAIRRHNSTSLAFNWMDLWMYEALEFDLEGNYASAEFLVRRAETMWRGNGLCEWSFLLTHTFSNHKLALLLLTARATGITLSNEDAMISHLWKMQNQLGGIASLSDAEGKPIGSSNTETTALTLLIYDQALLAKFPKIKLPNPEQSSAVLAFAVSIAFLSLIIVRRRVRAKALRPIDT